MSTKLLRLATPAIAACLLLSACSSSTSNKQSDSTPAAAGSTVVHVGSLSNGAGTQTDITVTQQDAIRAELPAAIRDGGTLKVAVGALPAGFPPLAPYLSSHNTSARIDGGQACGSSSKRSSCCSSGSR